MAPVTVITSQHVPIEPPLPNSANTTPNDSFNDSSLIGHLADYPVLRQTCLGIGFNDLTPDIFENVMKSLPFDAHVENINADRLHDLCKAHQIWLPRFAVSSIDFRVHFARKSDCYRGNRGECYFLMSLRRLNALWKTFTVHGRHFAPFNVGHVAKWIFASGDKFRVNVIGVHFLSVSAFQEFTDFLREICKSPDSPPVRVFFNECVFTRISTLNMKKLINVLIDECGVEELAFMNVKFEDFERLVKAISLSNAHKLKEFLFHSLEVPRNKADLIKPMFKPFYHPNRRTQHLSITGFSMPHELLLESMCRFCMTRNYENIPPRLRFVLSIAAEYTRQELHSVLDDVKNGMQSIRHRSASKYNHIFLELGVFESVDSLIGLQHAVIDVEVK